MRCRRNAEKYDNDDQGYRPSAPGLLPAMVSSPRAHRLQRRSRRFSRPGRYSGQAGNDLIGPKPRKRIEAGSCFYICQRARPAVSVDCGFLLPAAVMLRSYLNENHHNVRETLKGSWAKGWSRRKCKKARPRAGRAVCSPPPDSSKERVPPTDYRVEHQLALICVLSPARGLYHPPA